MTTIRLRHARLEIHDWGCTSYFADGSKADAVPHPWDHCYSIIAMRCGYGFDLMAYTVEHELAHHVIEECLFDRPSRVLWALAHGKPLTGPESAYEEMMAQGLQRFVRAAERPIIGNVDWDRIRNRFLQVAP